MYSVQKILIVDDVKDDRDHIKLILRESFGNKFQILEADSVSEAIKRIEENPQIVFLDVMLPDNRGTRAYEAGFEVLKKSKEHDPDSQVIMMSSTKVDAGTAVEALTEKDVFYYFVKSDMTSEKVMRVFKKAVEHYLLRKENKELKNTVKYYRKEQFAQNGLDAIIGKSNSINEIKETIKQIAPTESSVVITGPSGTGKELTAKAIHILSKRANNPFVKIDCTTIPKSLWHMHLFGGKKGAYTGLDENRTGFIKEADKGTIFFDEIGELDSESQTSLLRLIEEQKYRPLGEKSDVDADVRIIAATNKDLEDEVEKGTFREDLFFRLNVVHIAMPSLYERKEDIPEIVDHLLINEMKKQAKKLSGITDKALGLLMNYEWPGNIRQLRNVIERCVIYCKENESVDESLILKYGIPEYYRVQTGKYNIPYLIDQLRKTGDENKSWEIKNRIKEKIIAALEETNGNKKQACDLCGIGSRKTFYRYLKDFGIE